MDKSSITWTRGSDWWLSRTTMSGRERYPKQIRVGDLDRPRVYYPINRDALLALADEMDAYTKCDDERCGREMPPRVIHDFADRIREALGDCQRGVSGVGRRGESRGPSGQVAGVARAVPREGAGEKE